MRRDSPTWNSLSNTAERIGYNWGRMQREIGHGGTWWEGSGPSGDRTETTRDSTMTYECDAKLGNPRQADCSHLRYSQLQSLADSVSLTAGTTKFFAADTCSIGISASTSVTLTWKQVLAAVEDLIEICVNNPLATAVGGRAFYGHQALSNIGGRRKRDKGRGRDRSGGKDKPQGDLALHALPPTVNVSLFQQFEKFPDASNPVKEVQSCTWQKVVAHEDVRQCRGAHG
ncbi:MAG: hypothetical protein Q9187_003748 [Circinaria calcarea]